MKSLILAALLMTSTLVSSSARAETPAVDLSFASGAIVAHCYWEQGPVANSESILRMELIDAATQLPIALSPTLNVTLWMQMGSMTHGSSPTTITQAKDANGAALPGIYRVSKMYFVMHGSWEVRTKFTLPGQATELHSFFLTIP